jgi:hypothetical protein
MESKRALGSKYLHLVWFLPLVSLVWYWLALPGAEMS